MTAIWGHRGASAYAPENTIEAFDLAIRQGADGVELDVQFSSDGNVVVIHDETVDRTTTGRGRVADLTWDQLRGYHAAGVDTQFPDARIPLLAEVLELLRPTDATINVELKNGVEFYPGIEHKVVELVRGAGLADRVLVSSFNHWSLKTVQQFDPGVRLGLLFADGIYLPWEYAREFGAYAIHPHQGHLRVPGFVEYAHAAGIAVHVWTANSEAELHAALAAGVDAVITNHPDRAVRLRDCPPGAVTS